MILLLCVVMIVVIATVIFFLGKWVDKYGSDEMETVDDEKEWHNE